MWVNNYVDYGDRCKRIYILLFSNSRENSVLLIVNQYKPKSNFSGNKTSETNIIRNTVSKSGQEYKVK